VASEAVYLPQDRREVVFYLAGQSGQLQVQCTAPLPDNFSADKDVVVEGRLESPRLLRGKKVLTRCASKYESADRSAAPGASPEPD
jgi:cytochrome c-type biogenesis protein CcmE